MNIGLDLRSFGIPGEESYVRNLLCQFSKYEDHFYLFYSGGSLDLLCESANFQPVEAVELGFASLIASKFSRQVSAFPLEIFHSLHLSAPPETNLPYIVTIHQTVPLLRREALPAPFSRRYYFHLLKSCVRKASRIIAVSEAIKSYLVTYFELSPDLFSVIYQGVSEDYRPITDRGRVARVMKKYGIPSPYLLYLGEFSAHKNIVRLIQAFGRLPQDLRDEFHLVLGGKSTPEAARLKELSEKLHLSKRVIFTGYIEEEDLPALYNGAVAFVFPSLHEGFGLSPLEAMACGTPVVVSRSSSLPEVVGDAGLFINPESTEDLTATLIHLLTDFDLQDDLKEKGLKRAKNFSWKKTAEETLRLYRDVASS